MKKILAIDFGIKKIGLAIGDSDVKLAEPLLVVKFRNEEEAIREVSKISKISKISKVVLGISEGRMAKETKQFGKRLEKKLGIPVVYQDETLSTKEAQMRAIEAGIRRKKRRKLEDAYSATLILQNYLDSL